VSDGRRSREEQYWEMIREHVSLAVALQRLDEPARERVRANAVAKVSAFENDGKVRVPGVARCILGTKEDKSGTRPPDGARSSRLSSVTPRAGAREQAIDVFAQAGRRRRGPRQEASGVTAYGLGRCCSRPGQ
jgi:hypothetical protein